VPSSLQHYQTLVSRILTIKRDEEMQLEEKKRSEKKSGKEGKRSEKKYAKE